MTNTMRVADYVHQQQDSGRNFTSSLVKVPPTTWSVSASSRALRYVRLGTEQGTGATLPTETSLTSDWTPAQAGVGIAGRQRHLPSLSRAEEIVESIDPTDSVDARIQLVALSAIIADLWDEVADTEDEVYADMLAVLEHGVLVALDDSQIDDQRILCFREAVLALSRSHLTPGAVRLVRRRFSETGFSPLAFLSASENRDCTIDD